MIQAKADEIGSNVNTTSSVTYDSFGQGMLGYLTTADISTMTWDTQQFSTLSITPLSTLQISSIYTTTSSLNSINTINPISYDNDYIPVYTTKYIIAGSYAEYKDFLKRKSFNSDEYKFVSNSNVLRGMRNVHGYYVGSWRQRTDIEDIKLAIELANL